MNTWCGAGRLTNDPEIRTNNNMTIASFGIAVNRRFKREGQPDADFFTVNAFGKIAEFIEKYGKKGVKFEISGRLQQDRWTDKEGRNQSRVVIIADSVEFAESKNASSGTSSNNGYMGNRAASATAPSPKKDDDMEFENLAPGALEGLPFD